MIIDAHQHFWHYTPAEFPWIDGSMDVLQRDYLPGDLLAEIDRAGIGRVVSVQARQSLAETRWLLDLANEHPFVGGVVGWVPLAEPDVARHLDAFSQYAAFKAVRHVVQDEPNDSFLQDGRFNAGVHLLRRYDLAYDLLIRDRQLNEAISFVDRHPTQRFILDHLAKPQIRAAIHEPWRDQIIDLAQRENVTCKISGMVTEADSRHWNADQLRPYLDNVLAAFGPNRLMFGSDWPVLLLACSYERWHHTVTCWSESLSADEREWLFSRTAATAYRIDIQADGGET
jgi:L-fuconolactonase